MNKSTKHELDNGIIEYRLPNGLLHREDGPAIAFPDGDEMWMLSGVLHRTDGPAVVFSDVYEEYYLHGVEYDPVTFLFKSYEFKLGEKL